MLPAFLICTAKNPNEMEWVKRFVGLNGVAEPNERKKSE